MKQNVKCKIDHENEGMRNLKIGDIVYFDKIQKCIIRSIDEKEQRVTLKWFHIEDAWFYSGEPKLISKYFKEITLEFDGN